MQMNETTLGAILCAPRACPVPVGTAKAIDLAVDLAAHTNLTTLPVVAEYIQRLPLVAQVAFMVTHVRHHPEAEWGQVHVRWADRIGVRCGLPAIQRAVSSLQAQGVL
jgi:hypothetical protein